MAVQNAISGRLSFEDSAEAAVYLAEHRTAHPTPQFAVFEVGLSAQETQ
jgi:hypothetical protein